MSVRRRYGASTTQVVSFAEARIYKTQQADPHRRSEIGRTINELTDTVNEIQQELDRWQQEHRELKTHLDAVRAEQSTLISEKNRKQEASSRFKALDGQLETAEERLQEAQQRGSQNKQEMERLEKKLDEAVAKRAQAAIEFAVGILQLQPKRWVLTVL
jgi:chromosome segregation ATPase